MKPVHLLLFVLPLFLLATPLQAQKRDLALMERQAAIWLKQTHKSPADTVGLDLLNELVVMYGMHNQELKALDIAQSAVTIGEQMLTRSSGLDQRNVRAKLCNSYGLLCDLLRQQMAYDQAAEVAHRYILEAKLSRNNSAISAAYGHLARCFEQLNDPSSALPLRWEELGYATKAYGIDRAECHRRLGQVHASLGHVDSATYHFQQGLLMNDLNIAPQKTLGILTDLIDLYAGLGDLERMEQIADQMNAIGIRVPQSRYQQRIHGERSLVHFMQGRYQASIAELHKAEGLHLDAVNLPWRSVKHRLFALAYAAEHQNHVALQHMDSALTDYRNSLGLDKVRALARIQAEKQHERELQLAQAQVAAERSQKRLVMVMAASILALGTLGWLLLRATRIRARLLAEKNEQILTAQVQLVDSEKERAAEQVRTRIARDIHDSIGGELTKVVMLGEELMHRIDKDKNEVLDIVDHMRAQARSASAAINDVVWAADPEQDSVSSLMAHVERHAIRLFEGSAIALRCDLERPANDRTLSPLIKHNIFMVLKEALNNVLKYARPSEVEVALIVEGPNYILKVKDNGQGFNAGEQGGHGNGLRNMRSRAQLIGARLELHTDPGTGTVVVLNGILDSPSH